MPTRRKPAPEFAPRTLADMPDPDIRDSILDTIGNTPLVRLSRIGAGLTPQLVAKLEVFNPGGSVKDRIGKSMIDAAEKEGRIEPGKTTSVEATSGNTGIALAFVCAAKGYELVLTLPQGMSREREVLLRLYGVRVGGRRERLVGAGAGLEVGHAVCALPRSARWSGRCGGRSAPLRPVGPRHHYQASRSRCLSSYPFRQLSTP